MRKQSGNHSSKYALNPKQFEKDIYDKHIEHKVFKDMIKKFILMDPSKVDLRYKDTIEVLKELKEEFNL